MADYFGFVEQQLKQGVGRAAIWKFARRIPDENLQQRVAELLGSDGSEAETPVEKPKPVPQRVDRAKSPRSPSHGCCGS